MSSLWKLLLRSPREEELTTDAVSHWDTLDSNFRVEPGKWAVEVRPDAATPGPRAEFECKEWAWRGL